MSACTLTANSIRRAAAMLAVLVLTGGCATQRGIELPDISDWDRRQAVLAAADNFEFNGRIGVQSGAEGFNGKLRWSQKGSRFHATLSGPLGIGTVQIDGDGQRVEVTDKDGARTVLEDAEPELYARYGWAIPVQSLRYWALGIPDPDSPAETDFAGDGALELLRQRGWTVSYSRYQFAAGEQALPQRLTAQNSDNIVRLVVDQWIFH
ncbi:MAG TPA: lipoprotein insertase outer membrane protein LolB [Woeseiaceae bacterium]|nr:lipoprotein insertase outer membrane protein LolB [Woeseiaceae bacterium]